MGPGLLRAGGGHRADGGAHGGPAILAVADWPWLFLLNVPAALLAFALALRGLPPTERNIRPFDAASALLCAGLFGGLLFGIAGVAHRSGWLPVALAWRRRRCAAMGCAGGRPAAPR